MNFLPASVRDGKTALSDVLAVKGTAFYNDNSGLDANNDGQITVGDLAYVVYAQFQGDNPGIDRGPHVRDAIARTYELRPMERVHDPVYGDDYPLPYLTGSYGDMAAGISAMLAKGLTRIFSKAKI
jgi:hypothetical protein